MSRFWSEGIRFQCQGSGNCCVSHGEYGSVYVTLEDRRRLAHALGMKTSAFTRQYCELRDGIWKLKDAANEACAFLQNKRCGVYKARPTQCRTWPFWPEVMNAKTWSREVASFCPGVNKGRLWTPAEIEEQLKQQIESEKRYGS